MDKEGQRQYRTQFTLIQGTFDSLLCFAYFAAAMEENIKDEPVPEEADDELYEHYRIVVDKGQQPLRIDKFLTNRIEKVSRK